MIGILLLCFVGILPLSAKVDVKSLRVENLTNPLGVDTDQPRFSWVTTSDEKDVRQTAYQIIVSGDKGELWNSGKVDSDEQLWIPYAGGKLKSGMQCSWKVKVFTNKGETAWSEPQRFGIGLLKESHWSGRWIGLERLMPGEQRGQYTRLAARYVRSEFKLDKPVQRAIAYVAGIGLHELHVNGKTFDREVLVPMPTDYRKTVLYNTYDITSSLTDENCIGVVLGNGRLFPMRQNKPYKTPVFGLPKCRINILITFTDGTTKRISTDEKWKVTANGPIRSNNEYDGEEYDARQELTGWDQVGYDDSAWLQAERSEIPQGTLRAQMAPGMAMAPFTPEPTPLTSNPSPLTSTIYDFHQNMAGWVAFTPTGKPGDTIRVKYAEKLNPDGSLYLDNFRDARSEDIYICGSSLTPNLSPLTLSEWHPIFSYHGFRYAQITGPVKDVHAYNVSDNILATGRFECSDTVLNKVMHNAWWGIYSNYKGMPIDCPQRNERQPWLGDRTMGALGESFLFDNERLYTKWMRDICESQREDGVFSDVAPAFWNYYNDDVSWPAALPFCCDMLYRQFGNREAIDKSYPSIKRWLQHLMEEYGEDAVIAVGIHGGPMAVYPNPERGIVGLATETGDNYNTYWKVEQWPMGMVNRGAVSPYSDWGSQVRTELQKTAPASITVYPAVLSPTSVSLIVTVEGREGTVSGKLQVWIIEDNITAIQLMPDGTANQSYVHQHVFRATVNGEWGEDISVKEAESVSKNYDVPLQTDWNLDNLSVVAFVYNSQGVLQVVRQRLVIQAID